MSTVRELEGVISGIAAAVGPKVVGVGRFGSGVVIGEGTILTNAHVIRGEEVRVSFGDGRVATGTVAGLDVDADLAAVAADTQAVEPVDWGAEEVPIGSAVLALSNPGGRGLRATLGFVSSAGRGFRGPRGRLVRSSLEHTAPLPRGSSGSPVVDIEGRLLGINTLRLEGGLIVAIAADADLLEHVQSLARGEVPSRATLGLALASPRVTRRLRDAVGLPARDGLLVRGVVEQGPAERAGVEPGDLIVAVAGTPITGIDDLYDHLDRSSTGETLELALVRGTDERTVEVTLG